MAGTVVVMLFLGFTVVVIVGMVAMVVVIVGMVAMAKVWTAAVIDMLVISEALFIGTRAAVAIAMVFGAEIVVVALEFSGPIPFSGDTLSTVGGTMMGFVTGIDIEVLTDANANVFASLMTALKFAVPRPI